MLHGMANERKHDPIFQGTTEMLQMMSGKFDRLEVKLDATPHNLSNLAVNF